MKSKVDTLVTLAEEFLHVTKEPIQSAHTRLLLSERKLLDCAALGKILKLNSRDGQPDEKRAEKSQERIDDGADDSKSTGDDCTVRARVIRWLCSDPEAKALVDPFGIQVQGADILGIDMDSEGEDRFMSLASLVVPFPVVLTKCKLPSRLILLGAEIPFLNLGGSRVGSVEADMLKIKGDLYLRHGFRADGCITLAGASIGGDFDCTGARFDGQKHEGREDFRFALRAEGIKVTGDVLLRKWEPLDGAPPRPFVADGIVCLEGARIEGDLRCEGGSFLGPQKKEAEQSHAATGAIAASRINVSGGVFLGEGFQAHHEVDFTSAQVGGNFECSNGVFEHRSLPGEELVDALCLDAATIAQHLILDGSCVQGRLRFSGSKIGGDLDCDRCTVRGELVAQRTTVRGVWFWRNVKETALLLKLDLRDTSVGGIVDEEGSWPKGKILTWDGFKYDHFSKCPKSAKDRLKWLALQKEFAPQPYRQLAKVLKEDGDVSGAREVLFEMENLRHRHEMDNRRSQMPIAQKGFRVLLPTIWILLIRSWHWVLRKTVGYGYYPARALLWLVGLTLAGGFIYWYAYNLTMMKPTDSSAYQCFQHAGYAPAYYQRFHALTYSLANTFPVINIGKTDSWQPDPNPGTPVPPGAFLYFLRRRLTGPGLLTFFRHVQIFLGWLLTTLGVAAITGLTRKE
jgi:hypothetical protein